MVISETSHKATPAPRAWSATTLTLVTPEPQPGANGSTESPVHRSQIRFPPQHREAQPCRGKKLGKRRGREKKNAGRTRFSSSDRALSRPGSCQLLSWRWGGKCCSFVLRQLQASPSSSQSRQDQKAERFARLDKTNEHPHVASQRKVPGDGSRHVWNMPKPARSDTHGSSDPSSDVLLPNSTNHTLRK